MGGRKPDGVGTYPAGVAQLQRYARAGSALEQMSVPMLYRHNDLHSHLYFAMLDGSGQDLEKQPDTPTNVGHLHRQLVGFSKATDGRVVSGYVAGPGTQSNPMVRIVDAMLGFSWDERIEQAYLQLTLQAQLWKAADPDARISVASIGYSRGAVELPGLARLIDRYGIADPDGLRFGRDASGGITVESPLPPLVPAHEVAQAAVAIDPVGTGIPDAYDRRLPPSVISRLGLLAAEERRSAFPHTPIVAQGLTVDGAFLGITVSGAHSDAGGGNRHNGLEILAGNLITDYVNALSDVPLVQRRAPAADVETVVHRSEQGLDGLFQIGSSHAGAPRYLHEQLCVIVDPCRDSEPRDEALAARFDAQHPQVAPMPDAPAIPPGAAFPGATAQMLPLRQPVLLDDSTHPQHRLYQQALAGVSGLDARFGRAPDVGSRQLAGALAARAHEAGHERISHVVLGEERTRVFAVDTADLDAPQRRLAHVDIVPGRAQSMQASTRQAEQGGQARHVAPAHAPAVVEPQPARALAR